jgi:uncharacterized protein
MDDQTRLELEAATYRRLRDHLRARTDVQNIDLMTPSGFCRNCLSRWYTEAAGEHGIEMSKSQGREIVYGMAYQDWRDQFQTEAGREKQAAFQVAFAENVGKKED